MKLPQLLLCWALLTTATAPLRAEVLIGNLPTANDAGSNSIGMNFFGNTFERAVKFTMPATPYTLDNVVLRLTDAATGGPPLITIRADDDNGDDPGSVLATLSNPALGDALADFVFTPAGTVTFQANTSYWVHVGHATNAVDYQWMTSTGENEPTGAATWVTYRQRANAGEWGTNNTPSTFAVNATAVPEPATGLLALVGGLMLCARFGRRAQR